MVKITSNYMNKIKILNMVGWLDDKASQFLPVSFLFTNRNL